MKAKQTQKEGSVQEFIDTLGVFDKDHAGTVPAGELRHVLTALGEKHSVYLTESSDAFYAGRCRQTRQGFGKIPLFYRDYKSPYFSIVRFHWLWVSCFSIVRFHWLWVSCFSIVRFHWLQSNWNHVQYRSNGPRANRLLLHLSNSTFHCNFNRPNIKTKILLSLPYVLLLAVVEVISYSIKRIHLK